MATATNITARVDVDTLAIVGRLAHDRGQSRASFAAEAIRRVAESEADSPAFAQVGIDAADRGELVSNEDLMAELDAMIAKHEARCLD